MPSLGDIHQDHETIAREGSRAFKRTTLLGYEIPWNCFSFQPAGVRVAGGPAPGRKVAALDCYRRTAPKLRQRGVHPKHRPHPRHRERPGAGGGVRGVPVGDVRILVTATGAPGAASLLRGLRENGEQPVTLVGTDMRPQSAGRFLCDHFHEVPAGNDPGLSRRWRRCPARAGGLRVPAVVGRDPGDLARRRPVRRAGAGVQARLDRAGGHPRPRLPGWPRSWGSPTRAASRPATRIAFKAAARELGYPGGRRVHEAGRGQGRTRVPVLSATADRRQNLLERAARHAASAVAWRRRPTSSTSGGPFPATLVMELITGQEQATDAICRDGRTLVDQRQDARGDPGGTGDGVRADRPARPAGVVTQDDRGARARPPGQPGVHRRVPAGGQRPHLDGGRTSPI